MLRQGVNLKEDVFDLLITGDPETIYSAFLVQYMGGFFNRAYSKLNASEDGDRHCLISKGGVNAFTDVHLLVESTKDPKEKERAHGRIAFVLSGNTTAAEAHNTLATRFPCTKTW